MSPTLWKSCEFINLFILILYKNVVGDGDGGDGDNQDNFQRHLYRWPMFSTSRLT